MPYTECAVLWMSMLCLLVLPIPLVLCSLGDRSSGFQWCMAQCLQSNCSSLNEPKSLYWTCTEQCNYDCMWLSVDQFLSAGLPPPQYFGKWPFVQWFGCQEPASSLFSVLNCLAFVHLLRELLSLQTDTPLRSLWLGYAMTGVHTWLWSTLFHARDFWLTEHMDYFCAFASILYGLGAALIRVLSLPKVPVAVLCLSYYLYHIYYLAWVRFDYAYNMRAAVTVGVVSSVLWLVLCWRHRGHPDISKPCAIVVVGANALLMLELFDFPPFLWAFDAHSLWHLGTVPLPVFWAKFLKADLNMLREKMKQE